MRGGNSFIVQGDLIRGLKFTASVLGVGPDHDATMGEFLTAHPKQKVLIKVMVKVPDLNNLCPYTFENSSLAPLGMRQSLNRPVLHHVGNSGRGVNTNIEVGKMVLSSSIISTWYMENFFFR
ncbi:MAG: hypothetical protein PHX53_05220 [Syntrophales bacterium]|nr:hypothetical protein [Syntrophales bacterium]